MFNYRFMIALLVLLFAIDPLGQTVAAATLDGGAEGSQLFLEITSPGNGLETSSSSTIVAGKAPMGTKVLVNGKLAKIDDNGGLSQQVQLRSGTNIISITVRNQAGKTLTVTRTVICDQNKPQLVLLSPAEGELVNTPYTIIKGLTEKDCFVKINGDNVYPDAKGFFSHVVDYSPYYGSIIASSTDRAGNTSELIRTIEFAGNQVTSLSLPKQLKLGMPTSIKYNLGMDGLVTAEIRDNHDGLIRRLADESYRPAGQNSLPWDGTKQDGTPVEDGKYRFVVTLKDLDGKSMGGRLIEQLAVRVPNFTFPVGQEKPFNPLRGQFERIEGELSQPATITLTVYRDSKSKFNVVAKNFPKGKVGLNWNGKDKVGKLLPDGKYKWILQVASLTDSKFAKTYRGTFWVDKGAPEIAGLNLKGQSTPNGYRLQVQYRLSEPVAVSMEIYDGNLKSVFKLINGVNKKPGLNTVSWNGTNAQGRQVPPGKYTLRVSGSDLVGNRSKTVIKALVITKSNSVRKTRPRPMSLGLQSYSDVVSALELEDIKISPTPFKLGQGVLVCRYVSSKPCTVTMFIYGSQDKVVKIVTTRNSRSGNNNSRWDGRIDGGDLATDGSYRVTVIAEDSLGNSSPFYQVPSFQAARVPQISGVTVLPKPFNPKEDKIAIEYQLAATANLRVSLGSGKAEQLLFSGIKSAGNHRLEWDGTDAKGKLVADGAYPLILNAQNVKVPAFKSVYRDSLTIEKEVPFISGYSLSADPFRSSLGRPLLIKYSISEPAQVTVTVSQNNQIIRYLEKQASKRAGLVTTYWDGLDGDGKRVEGGKYVIALKVVDSAGKVVQHSSSMQLIAGLFVTSSKPSPGASNFSVDGTVKLSFNDKIKRQTNYPGILLQVEGKRVPAKVEMTGGQELSITPYQSLEYNTQYTILARKDGVKDSSGRQGNVEYIAQFRTLAGEQEDTVLPEVDLSPNVNSEVYQEGSRKKVIVFINEGEIAKILSQTVEVKRFIVPVNVDLDETNLMLTESLRSELAKGKHHLELRTPLAAVSIPLEDASAELQKRAPSSAILKITIIRLGAESLKPFSNAAKNGNFKVVTAPVSFRLEALGQETTVQLIQAATYSTGTLFLGEKTIPRYVGVVGINPEGSLVPLASFQTLKQGRSAFVTRLRRCNSVALIQSLKTFTDTNKHWAREQITEVSSKLFLEGQDKKRFNPNGRLTRAELAVCIARVLSLQPDFISIHFSDVPTNTWYAGQVGAMARAGILKGFPNGTFRPGAVVSRQEMAVALAGAMKYLGTKSLMLNDDQTAVLDKFQDRKKVAAWGARALGSMVVNKIMVGNDQGFLAPEKPVTRAELAALLQRVMQKNRY